MCLISESEGAIDRSDAIRSRYRIVQTIIDNIVGAASAVRSRVGACDHLTCGKGFDAPQEPVKRSCAF